jgi:hypothetical protein
MTTAQSGRISKFANFFFRDEKCKFESVIE